MKNCSTKKVFMFIIGGSLIRCSNNVLRSWYEWKKCENLKSSIEIIYSKNYNEVKLNGNMIENWGGLIENLVIIYGKKLD